MCGVNRQISRVDDVPGHKLCACAQSGRHARAHTHAATLLVLITASNIVNNTHRQFEQVYELFVLGDV
jgi:hypothetical protein